MSSVPADAQTAINMPIHVLYTYIFLYYSVGTYIYTHARARRATTRSTARFTFTVIYSPNKNIIHTSFKHHQAHTHTHTSQHTHTHINTPVRAIYCCWNKIIIGRLAIPVYNNI